MNPSRPLVVGCLLATLLAVPGLAAGQNARIIGSVRDQTGAIVPGATVTAKNQETGLTRTDVSDDKGDFRLPALPPGLYQVSVELSGFGTETRPDILLTIEQTASLAFTLKPASVAENVTVTGEAPIIDTNRSEVSTAVSTKQIQDLPVASRRWIDLVMLVPGTSQDNIRGFFYRGNANIGGGTREYSNMSMVDGVNNTWAEMGEPRQNFAMDSIREFKVSTSNYKAEYGLATGGLMTVVSKSGTNTWHGSALVFLRDASLTAKEYFQKTKPDYRRYQYGGSLGGPILKDRTHFFYAYERTDENQFFTVSAGGLWPTVPLGNQVIQGEGTYKSDQDRWTYTLRVDHQLRQNQSLFLRIGQENEYRPVITTGGRTHPTASFDFAVPRTSAVVGHTWIMNDRLLNDFRFQYAFSKYEVAAPYSHGSLAPGDFGTDRVGRCSTVYSYPSIVVGGCGNSQMGPEKRYQVRNDVSFLQPGWGGTHQWKAGLDFSFIPFDADNLGNPLGQFNFPKDKPYDANDPSTWPVQYTASLPRYANVPTSHFAGYVQDDWEAARSLTFNLGVRYDIQKGSFNEDIPGLMNKITEKRGAGWTIPEPYAPFFQNSEQRGDRNNFGPRVGFAWDPLSKGNLNVHAAYGLFYDNIRTLMNFDELWWPQRKSIVIANPNFQDPLQGKPIEAYFSTAPPNIWVMDPENVNAFAHQYNGGVTYLLTRDMAVTADVSFVDRHSDRDLEVDINLPDPVTKVKPYPAYGQIRQQQSSQNNQYKALLVKLEKRLSRRHQYMVSYTLAKATDSSIRNSQGDHYGYQRVDSASAGDRRHRLVLSGIVQLPWQSQVSVIGDFRSSLSFNPGSSLDINRDGYTGDNPAGVAFRSGCRALDIDAINTFRASRGLAAVSAGDVACPTFANLDLRFSKSITFGQTGRVELIAQLFNIFDRANFAVPSANPGATTFGTVNAILANINAPARQAEFALRIQF